MAPDVFVSGGYYLTRVADVPDGVLKASSEACALFPDTWAIQWTAASAEERAAGAAAFGLSPDGLRKATAWATASFQKTFGWPSAFYSLEGARDAYQKFFRRNSRIVILGLGLHESDVERFLSAAAPPPQEEGYAPVGKTGLYECVSSGRTIEPGGDPAGFEVLTMQCGLLTASRPGLWASYVDASRRAESVAGTHKGAGLWLPWLLTIYSTA